MLHFIAGFLIQIHFLVNTKPDKRLTHNKHAHFLRLECIVSTQSTSSVEKLINKVMSLIFLPRLLCFLFFSWEQRLISVFSCTVAALLWSCLKQQMVRAETLGNRSQLFLSFFLFWCCLVCKNHNWWSKLLQHACCSVKQPSPSCHLVT